MLKSMFVKAAIAAVVLPFIVSTAGAEDDPKNAADNPDKKWCESDARLTIAGTLDERSSNSSNYWIEQSTPCFVNWIEINGAKKLIGCVPGAKFKATGVVTDYSEDGEHFMLFLDKVKNLECAP